MELFSVLLFCVTSLQKSNEHLNEYTSRGIFFSHKDQGLHITEQKYIKHAPCVEDTVRTGRKGRKKFVNFLISLLHNSKILKGSPLGLFTLCRNTSNSSTQHFPNIRCASLETHLGLGERMTLILRLFKLLSKE